MLGAIAILFFAWTINKVVGDAQTGKYLSSLVSGSIPVQFLPVILFILGSAMAFSTGTSWGTFGIMLPIAAAMATNSAPELLLPCLSAVMAGAVCGDHCSRFRIQRFCRQLGQNVTTWITSPHNYLMQQLLQQQVLWATL